MIETRPLERAPKPGGYRRGRRPKMLVALSDFSVEVGGERLRFTEGRDQVVPDWQGFRERPNIRSRFAPQDSARAKAAVARAGRPSRHRASSSPRLSGGWRLPTAWRLPTSSASWRLSSDMSLAQELAARRRALGRLR
jgi:hypothetical protein